MKVLAANRRAGYDYEITDKLVAGISLTGTEVKSIKSGNISLKGSYVTINQAEAFLVNAHVSPYSLGGTDQHDPTRSRKLLLHRREINRLIAARQSGLTAVPTAILQDRGLVKVEIGLGRGKKRFDKRETIKQRETERRLRRQA